MARRTSRGAARQSFTFSVPHNGWSTPQRVTLGEAGLLARCVLRAPASSTVTGADIMVYHGDYHETQTDRDARAGVAPIPTSGIVPDTAVPAEDRVYYRTGITVAGHAVDADDDYDLLANSQGAVFDGRALQEYVWVAIKGTAGTDTMAGVKLVLEAVDVE